jgi:hypothetical protein
VQILNSGEQWAFCSEDETVKNIQSLEELFKGRHPSGLSSSCVRAGTCATVQDLHQSPNEDPPLMVRAGAGFENHLRRRQFDKKRST